MNTADRFLILGAGPVGLAVAKAFGAAGLPYVQAEATDHVGGNWAHGVYDTAHIISSRKTTEYADYPMPASWPDFPSALQMKSYYEDYARTFGLLDHIRFGAEVVAVVPRPDERFDVTFADGTVEAYKGVVVCNGHHWSKSFPAWTRDFKGQVLHSKDYKRPSELAGRRVLVLGGGNSGCDIVSEAARVATSADWSLRRGYWFMPKTLFGRPSVELMSPWLPVPAQRALVKALLRVTVGPYESYGLPRPDHDLFEAHPTISTEVFHYLRHGKIRPRGDVVRAEGQEVVFADGTRETYDLVVCATGFDLSYPFLPDGTVEIVGKVAQLYGSALLRSHKHLYIVGTSQPRYGLGPLITPAAELLARLAALQDEIALPLGEVFFRMGQRPPETHLVDPHQALRQLAAVKRLFPLLRWRARRVGGRRDGPIGQPAATESASGRITEP